jgi:hypothetical protein
MIYQNDKHSKIMIIWNVNNDSGKVIISCSIMLGNMGLNEQIQGGGGGGGGHMLF